MSSTYTWFCPRGAMPHVHGEAPVSPSCERRGVMEAGTRRSERVHKLL